MAANFKKNIRDHWWKSMTQLNDNIVGIDAAISCTLQPGKQADMLIISSDPMIDNRIVRNARVDHLLEAHADKLAHEAEGIWFYLNQWMTYSQRRLHRIQLIEDNKITCAISGTSNWTDIRQFCSKPNLAR